MEVMKFMKIIKIMKRNMVCGLYITMAGMTMTACGQMTGAEVSAEIHTGELPQAGAGEEHVSGSDIRSYEDNFTVPKSDVSDFAKEIKAAVASKDLDTLASLASYPLYIGFKDGGISIDTAQELTALGRDRIFTPEMLESIEGADEEGMSPSMAGFSMTKEGIPNIIFGVSEGRLAVKGINY
ncbi:hypothetical protein D4758_03935 [Enterocloster citroniae]|nr:hypothetical protein [Enterocloster citroniae]